MKMNHGDLYETSEGLAAGTYGVGTHNGASVDHAKGRAATFVINCGAFVTSLNAKIQFSDNDVDWTDEPAAGTNEEWPGNDVDYDFAGPGQVVLDVPNPRARFSRCVLTSGGAGNVAAVVNVLGPLNTIGPAATVQM